ncbi:MAG TPA: TSUP family transporter [Oligoflexia bacterium]|nr:TSUP family transporter [Oligoflexia bacterium]HMR23742.1 TSUP family transporter [Oligoflexia bacterium]
MGNFNFWGIDGIMEFALLIMGCFFAGFVDAVAGGGGLITVPLMLNLGLATKVALGTNKIIGIMASFTSSIRYASSKKMVWRIALPATFAAFLGGACGALIASQLSNEFLKPVVIFLLLFVALYSLLQKNLGKQQIEAKLKHTAWPFVVGFIIGGYDGFFGPGTGTFMMIVFVSLFGLSLLNASASARIVNFASNLGALLLFSFSGYVDFKVAIWGALASACGALLGASLSIKRGHAFIRPVYLAVVWFMLIKLVLQFLGWI